MPTPVIDLFAGAGGLGEGFASVNDHQERPAFRLALSIEKDADAHATALLRVAARLMQGGAARKAYVDHVSGRITREQLRALPEARMALDLAARICLHLELGRPDSDATVDSRIATALQGEHEWVLVGGPPCQAYSVAGRARRVNDPAFLEDARHFLYQEYLRILRLHRPAVFVLENVKGLLSSSHGGSPMFDRIIADLSRPSGTLHYEIRSFVSHCTDRELTPEHFVIESERYGVPQRRHRVVLLGVRSDLRLGPHPLLVPSSPVTVADAIGGLPRLRSRLSREPDDPARWALAVLEGVDLARGWGTTGEQTMLRMMREHARLARGLRSHGGPFVPSDDGAREEAQPFVDWVRRPDVGGHLQHEARAHRRDDLARYLFATSFAALHGRSPPLDAFPPLLLPAHRSARRLEGRPHFRDRFRVQCRNEPASTIVSHLGKDGHYFIHPDPVQCRSLTVREAARLQTFPDDFHFEGGRTACFTQIGNAVPPLLARQLAQSVHALLVPAQGMTSRSSTASEPVAA